MKPTTVLLSWMAAGLISFAGAQGAVADPGCGGAWTRLETATTPPARAGHSAIYDPVRDRVVVFGGASSIGSPPNNEVWALNLTGTPNWELLSPAGVPPPGRYFHSAVYDPIRDRMIIFGGGRSSDVASALNDTWALSLAGEGTWTQLNAQGTVPEARSGHGAVYDAARDRMVSLLGAGNMLQIYAQVWTFSPSEGSWSRFQAISPNYRSGTGVAFDPARNRVLVFGGSTRQRVNGYLGNRYWNETWWLDLGEIRWDQAQPSPPPRAVAGCSAILDPARDRVIVFGGGDDSGMSADVWALGLPDGAAWESVHPAGASPPPRSSHTAVYDSRSDRMIVFGGRNSTTAFGDTWALSWLDCSAVGVPRDTRRERKLLSEGRVRPMPASGRAAVEFTLDREADADLQVFDLAGRRIFASTPARLTAGTQQLVWSPSRDTQSGVYTYVLTVRAGAERATKTGLIVRTR